MKNVIKSRINEKENLPPTHPPTAFLFFFSTLFFFLLFFLSQLTIANSESNRQELVGNKAKKFRVVAQVEV